VAAHQHGEAEGDRREQPVQHSEDHDGEHGGERDQPIATPAQVIAEHGGAQGLAERVDHDRRQHRLRDEFDPLEEQQHQHQQDGGAAEAGNA
jgi:hypothetical protein